MSDYICPHNCAYRTNAGYCGMTGGYDSCQYIKYLEKLEKEKTNVKPYAGKRTNADKLRAMSDEKLAEWMAAHNERSAVCPNFGAHGCQASCIQCWLDWLREEAQP